MMAYRQNILTFAESLRDLTAGGKLEDIELARNAFAEVKHSMEKMDEIHQSQIVKSKTGTRCDHKMVSAKLLLFLTAEKFA